MRELVILEDDRYAYAALLSLPADAPIADRAAFRALVQSIEMIPRRRGRARAAAAEALGAWAA